MQKSAVPSYDDEGKYTKKFIRSLIRGNSDIQTGRVYSSEEVRKNLNRL